MNRKIFALSRKIMAWCVYKLVVLCIRVCRKIWAKTWITRFKLLHKYKYLYLMYLDGNAFEQFAYITMIKEKNCKRSIHTIIHNGMDLKLFSSTFLPLFIPRHLIRSRLILHIYKRISIYFFFFREKKNCNIQ